MNNKKKKFIKCGKCNNDTWQNYKCSKCGNSIENSYVDNLGILKQLEDIVNGNNK